MTEYSIKNVKGHILIETDGGLVLVDTGSPASFHEDGKIAIGEKVHSVPTNLLIVNTDYIQRQVGAEVKGLIGMDIISKHTMAIDVKNGILTFDCGTEGWTSVQSSSSFSLPAVDINLAGRPAKVLIDTGAPTSYVLPEFTADAEPVGTVEDFSPMLGGGDDTFETNIFELSCSFAGQEFPIRLGNAPATVNMQIRIAGAQGVIGMELLKRFKFLITPHGVCVKAFGNGI